LARGKPANRVSLGIRPFTPIDAEHRECCYERYHRAKQHRANELIDPVLHGQNRPHDRRQQSPDANCQRPGQSRCAAGQLRPHRKRPGVAVGVRQAIADAIGDGNFADAALDNETLVLVEDQFRRFSDERIAPHAQNWHREDVLIPDAVIAEMAELGVFGLTAPEEWGGANEAHVLSDGTIGVLGHIARMDAEGKHYYPMVFCLDPESGQAGPLKMVATRRCFPPGPAKRPDLEDVIFSGGLRRGDDGSAVLYAGICDAWAAQITIPDPFLEYA